MREITPIPESEDKSLLKKLQKWIKFANLAIIGEYGQLREYHGPDRVVLNFGDGIISVNSTICPLERKKQKQKFGLKIW